MNRIHKVVAFTIALGSVLCCTGCNSALDGEYSQITPYYAEPASDSQDTIVEISTYDEFKNSVRAMVAGCIDSDSFRITSFDRTNLESALSQACQEVALEDPLGSYAVYYISCSVTPIVSYNDVQVNIMFKRTASEISSLSTVYSDRYLQYTLLSSMRDYATSCGFYTSLEIATSDYIRSIIKEHYYSNPLDIIMMPAVDVTSYPSTEGERIIDVAFSYDYSAGVLSNMTSRLNNATQDIVESAVGSTDYEMLLSLCEALISTGGYLPRLQNPIDATAYGIIINHLGSSEGFAMAYKALCDKLGIQCIVVNGKFQGEDHFWNIVTFDGASYHTDVTACRSPDLPMCFLKGDEYMKNEYWWDTSTVPACDSDYGTFTAPSAE